MWLAFTTIGTTVVLVYLGNKIDLWETWPVITVIIWTVTAGMAILMDLGNALKGSGSLMNRIRSLLSFPIVLSILVNFTIFSWWLEFILVPILFLLAVLTAMWKTRIEWKPLERLGTSLIGVYAAAMLSLTIKDVVVDNENWKLLIQAFTLPIFLTLTTGVYLAVLVKIERVKFIKQSSSRTISQREYGKDWPLTIDSATLYERFNAVWVEVDKKKYPLNGRAHSILPHYGHSISDLNEIWKDDPNIEGMKISIHQLIQDGLALEDSPTDPTHS